jgi:hypothetical protein
MYAPCMYCVIKCVKTKHMLKGNFASSVFHSCDAKTQKTQICVTGPQCVKTKRILDEICYGFQRMGKNIGKQLTVCTYICMCV